MAVVTVGGVELDAADAEAEGMQDIRVHERGAAAFHMLVMADGGDEEAVVGIELGPVRGVGAVAYALVDEIPEFQGQHETIVDLAERALELKGGSLGRRYRHPPVCKPGQRGAEVQDQTLQLYQRGGPG